MTALRNIGEPVAGFGYSQNSPQHLTIKDHDALVSFAYPGKKLNGQVGLLGKRMCWPMSKRDLMIIDVDAVLVGPKDAFAAVAFEGLEDTRTCFGESRNLIGPFTKCRGGTQLRYFEKPPLGGSKLDAFGAIDNRRFAESFAQEVKPVARYGVRNTQPNGIGPCKRSGE